MACRLSDAVVGLASLGSRFRSAFVSLCLCGQEEGEGFTLDGEVFRAAVVCTCGFLPGERRLPEVPPVELVQLK